MSQEFLLFTWAFCLGALVGMSIGRKIALGERKEEGSRDVR